MEKAQTNTSAICSGKVDSCKILHHEIEQLLIIDLCIQEDEDTAPAIDDLMCREISTRSVRKDSQRYYCNLPVKQGIFLPNNKSHETRTTKENIAS